MQAIEEVAATRTELKSELWYRRQRAEAAYFKGERGGEEGLDAWLESEWNIPRGQGTR